MKLKMPDNIQKIINQVTQANYDIYLVGGAVRDLLLDRPIKDWDFTTNATPEQILQVFPDGFYNNHFGTVGISLDKDKNKDETKPTQIIEITTMRKESDYTDHRHPSEIVWAETIEEDLKRRDFTINAMATKLTEDLDEPEIVDPFNGQKDLQEKTIRAVGDPIKRFTEDALRLMRAIRFATQLQFVIEPLTFEAIKTQAPSLTKISAERIRDELFKILASDYPYEGMIMLRSSGLLSSILPEIDDSFGTVQEGPKHDRVYDIGDHAFNALKFCPSKDPVIRFATLIHDVGKLKTYNVQADGNVTFYGHDVVGGKMAEKICQRLHLSKKETEKIVTLVRWHLFTVDEKQTDSAIRRFVKNVGIDNLEAMFALREGDRLGGGTQRPTSWRLELFKKRIQQVLTKPFSITDLKVNGQDVMEVLNIPASRKVGEVLKQLFAEVAEDKLKNEREYLLKRIKELN